MSRCIGEDCGCPTCWANKYPQYALPQKPEQMAGICGACQGMLVYRNGALVHSSPLTTCPGVIRR